MKIPREAVGTPERVHRSLPGEVTEKTLTRPSAAQGWGSVSNRDGQ